MENFILASKSPRRIEILGRYNLNFSVVESEINEIHSNYSNSETLAMAMAFEKAYNVAKKYESKIVLAADTVVSINNIALGKPSSRDNAFSMLKQLSGKEHQVITAYSVVKLSDNIKLVEYVSTLVKFRKLSDADMEKYLDSGEYKDKAGAYAIQGLGRNLVEEIVGDYDNIVGLPIKEVVKCLSSTFQLELIEDRNE